MAEKDNGIHKFHADPEMSRNRISLFATADGIEASREGLAMYACSGGIGYLILSSQGNSTFKIYERQGKNKFVKTVVPTDEHGIIDIDTEGLDATSSAAPNYPNGFVVAQNDDSNKFHIYDWADIAEFDLAVCVNGDIAPEPNIVVTPASHDFAQVPLNTNLTQSFSVKNIGKAELTVSTTSLLDNEADELSIASGAGPFSLLPGESHEVVVRFNPISIDKTHAKLRFINNDRDKTPLDVSITGSGIIPKPEIEITPDS